MPPSVTVIGVGGIGIRVASRIKSRLNARAMVIGEDVQRLSEAKADRKILVGVPLKGSRSSNVGAALKELIDHADMTFVCCAGPKWLDLASKVAEAVRGGKVVGIVAVPSVRDAAEIAEKFDALIVLEECGKFDVAELFERVVEDIVSATSAVEPDGVAVRLDCEVKSPNEVVVRQHPIIDINYEGVEDIFVHVHGDLSLDDVEKIVEIVWQRINPKARMIWSASAEKGAKTDVLVAVGVRGIVKIRPYPPARR